MMNFEEKVALVTGGGSGIGQACCLMLAKYGAKVVVSDINDAGGYETVNLIKNNGGEAVYVKANVADPEDVHRLISEAVKRYGKLDVAVNNAGVGDGSPAADKPIDEWQRVIDINLSGVFYCVKYELAEMLKNGGGVIVNMASILGSVGFPTASAYVAAKHGVIGLTKNVALEYATQGIRINAVGPAFIETPLIADLGDEALGQIRAITPQNRLGKPEEVAALVVFLASDEASYITGSYHLVDGGYTAQ